MPFLRRTVSALAVAAALAGTGSFAHVHAQSLAATQAEAPADELSRALELQGLPKGLLKWSSVERTTSGLVARDVYLDVAAYNLGYNTIPLGQLTVSDLVVDGDYVLRFRGRFDGMNVDLANLMMAGQKMGQAAASTGQFGGMVAMGAGYFQGLGYKTLDVGIDFDTVTDLAAGTMVSTGGLNVGTAFDIDIETRMTGVDKAYLDWARTMGVAMYLDQSPETQAAVQRAVSDPNGPAAKVGFARYGFAFTDLGLMPKIEGLLAPMRAQMLGTNPDGSPKTSMSDADIEKAAAEMGQSMGMPAEKVEPLVRAFSNFILKPQRIAIAVNAAPPFTIQDFLAMQNTATGAAAPAIDWASRVTFEASN